MKKAILIILDGFGYSEKTEFNAIENAKTPFIDHLKQSCPNTLIHTSGTQVGLPEGQMGNSEVGHITIGSGRIVYQDSSRIDKSISDGDFFKNSVLLDAIRLAKEKSKKIHLMGLLSDGGVHSHQNHLYALLDLLKQQGISQAYIHAFLDGRDTAPQSALSYIDALENKIDAIKLGTISSVCGRYYAMDRDNRWERIEAAYRAMTTDTGAYFSTAKEGIEKSYQNNITDEFVKPFSCGEKTHVETEDIVIFFNFRADRARELSRAFADRTLTRFQRDFLNPHFVQFTEYHSAFPLPTAFPKETLHGSLGEILAKEKKKQFRCAETEKYAHITFFFNGGSDQVFDGETRLLVPSPSVSTYDQRPEMSAYEVTYKVKEAITSNQYDFIAVNYANSDMLGHTGNYDATVEAIEVLDSCIEQVVSCAEKQDYDVLITADHGNSEQMIDYESGEAFTQHTTGPVPLIYIGKQFKNLKENGSLKDIAPSILAIMGIPKGKEMTGQSLVF